MKTKAILFILFTFILCEISLAESSSDEWNRADHQILRLQPTVFTNLPENIMIEVKKRGCLIPQSYASSHPHNVIQGQFQVEGQTDWAVLCSTDKISSILLFWGGDTRSVSEIAKSPDKIWLQRIGGSKIGYSRYISSVGGGSIIENYQANGGPKPPSMDHEGIDDGFLEKGSTVHYWHEGYWLEFAGPH